MSDSEKKCDHSDGWEYELEGERWLADTADDVHSEADHRWCPMCGELWFRAKDGSWFQKYWTAEEIAEIERESKALSERLAAFFDDDDDS